MLVVFLVSFTMKDGDLSRNWELSTIGSGVLPWGKHTDGQPRVFVGNNL